MRLMIKFSFDSHDDNEVVASGKIQQLFERLMQDLKPEAAYFYPEAGDRGGVLFVNAKDSSELVSLVEPFWFGLKAKVSITPVMSAEDLMKGMAGIPAIAARYR